MIGDLYSAASADCRLVALLYTVTYSLCELLQPFRAVSFPGGMV